MLFDITTAARDESIVLPENASSVDFDYIAASFWAEHCVECGAPVCYKTCNKFKASPSGCCRRLTYGIIPVKLSNGSVGCAVRFNAWGKIELDTDGRVVAVKTARVFRAIDYVLSKIAAVMTRLFWGKVPKRLSTFISFYKRRRDMLIHALGHPMDCQVWIIDCYAQKQEHLTAAVSYLDEGEVLVHPLELKPGLNHFEFDVHGLKPGAYFRIYSITGTTSTIVFANLAVGGKMSKPTGKTNKKPPAKLVKCVAWDLDNTVWKGILVEDGPDGVQLREEVVKAIKVLDSRGIMNTIASKNDYDPVWKQLTKFGIAEYFVFPRIDWLPKSGNIQAIAKDMNIGIDTFAFVDDSAHERGEVSENLPMVRVYNEAQIVEMLKDPAFNPPVSAESAKRRFSYLAEMTRRQSASVFTGSHEDFLRACQIELICERVEAERTVKRCWELVNRTNQLTLAAHRYTEAQFAELLKRDECYAVSCHDKYGDYGIVGFVAIERQANVAKITEFVMSCRVARKLCEQSVVLAVAKRMALVGCDKVVANAVPTGRNMALMEAFDAMPFKRAEQAGQRIYTLIIEPDKDDYANVFRNPLTWKEAE